MAHRSMDNGRDETHREADVAPPGSRERAESDLTGWNPARDEESSTRQGRYYRAATMRMALPRTQVDDGPREDVYGTPPEDSGPYGRDDRDSRYATGWGPRHDTGEQDVELSRQRADYRPWDRSGYGGGEPSRPQPPQGSPTATYASTAVNAARMERSAMEMRAPATGWTGAPPSARAATRRAPTAGLGQARLHPPAHGVTGRAPKSTPPSRAAPRRAPPAGTTAPATAAGVTRPCWPAR